MTLFGAGRAAILDDPSTADRLGWPRRRRSLPEPELVLRPRTGDLRREPWITPPGWRRSQGPTALWGRGRPSDGWEYLAEPNGVLRYLRRLAEPTRRARRVGIAGLGRVGGTAAAVLASMTSTSSGISELLIGDTHAANLSRWFAELASITRWRTPDVLPAVSTATPEEMMARCDVLLFAASDAVPPLGTRGDVRHVQFDPNRELLRTYLAAASRAEFSGLFLIVSDPVESLALAAFHDSNVDSTGRFSGDGMAPERVGGLALAVMWGRALAHAQRRGWSNVGVHGGAYGPHSDEVVVFDDLRRPDPVRSSQLTRAAREGNLELRAMGFLPYVGPAISSVALSLPPLLSGREVLASLFLDGVYLGGPTRRQFGLFPIARRLAPEVREALDDVHARLVRRAASLGLAPAV